MTSNPSPVEHVTPPAAPVRVPEGWQLVPKEPTQEMLDAVTAADQQEPFSDKTMRGVFVEMLSASPSPVDSRDGLEVSTGVLNDMLLARAPDCRWTIASILKQHGLNYRQRLDYMRAALSAALAAKEQQP